jgi:hypothetical protein
MSLIVALRTREVITHVIMSLPLFGKPELHAPRASGGPSCHLPYILDVNSCLSLRLRSRTAQIYISILIPSRVHRRIVSVVPGPGWTLERKIQNDFSRQQRLPASLCNLVSLES